MIIDYVAKEALTRANKLLNRAIENGDETKIEELEARVSALEESMGLTPSEGEEPKKKKRAKKKKVKK